MFMTTCSATEMELQKVTSTTSIPRPIAADKSTWSDPMPACKGEKLEAGRQQQAQNTPITQEQLTVIAIFSFLALAIRSVVLHEHMYMHTHNKNFRGKKNSQVAWPERLRNHDFCINKMLLKFTSRPIFIASYDELVSLAF
jgi:hypothetical protein